MSNTPKWYDDAAEEFERLLDKGMITLKDYNREMIDLDRELQWELSEEAEALRDRYQEGY